MVGYFLVNLPFQYLRSFLILTNFNGKLKLEINTLLIQTLILVDVITKDQSNYMLVHQLYSKKVHLLMILWVIQILQLWHFLLVEATLYGTELIPMYIRNVMPSQKWGADRMWVRVWNNQLFLNVSSRRY